MNIRDHDEKGACALCLGERTIVRAGAEVDCPGCDSDELGHRVISSRYVEPALWHWWRSLRAAFRAASA